MFIGRIEDSDLPILLVPQVNISPKITFHTILQSDFAGLALSSVRVSPGLSHIQSFAPVLDDHGELRGKRAMLQLGDALDLLDFDGREFYVHGFELFSHGVRIVNTSALNLSTLILRK